MANRSAKTIYMTLSGSDMGVIGAGADLASGLFNMAVQGRQNRINRKWQENMYFQQRRDALADWAMQNEYNSPKAQMARFAEANLNPNLIYGQMGNSAVVRSSDAPSSNAPAPKLDMSNVGRSLQMGYAIENQKANTDNVRMAIEVAREEIALKKAQEANVMIDSANKAVDQKSKEFFLDQAKALSPAVLEGAELSNRLKDVEITKGTYDYLLNLRRDAREARLTDQSIKRGVEEILTLRVNRSKTDQERQNLMQMLKTLKEETYSKALGNFIEEMEVEARQAGYSWKDGTAQRLGMELLDRLSKDGKANDSTIESRKERWRRLKR